MHYSPEVLARIRDPKHVGWMPRDAADVGTGEAGSLDRGTLTRIQVRRRELGLKTRLLEFLQARGYLEGMEVKGWSFFKRRGQS